MSSQDAARRLSQVLKLEGLEDRCLPSYTVFELPTFPGGQISQGQAINNAGQVAGIADLPSLNVDRAYLYDPSSGLQDLGSLNGRASEGFALNNLGQVTGFSDVPSAFHAFLSGDGGLVDLGTPGGDFSVGYAVNDQGDVAGAATVVPGSGAPFRPSLYVGGAMQDLGTFGGNSGEAHGINSADHVVGWAQTASGISHAFLFSLDVGLLDLGTLPGGSDSIALAVNESDQITGSSTVGGDARAFLYTANAGFQDLGTLPGDGFSIGYGINDLGQAVGISGVRMQHSRAVLFSDGQVFDLNDLIPPDSGVTLQRALSINDQGQIVVEGFANAGRQPHTYVLTPDETHGPQGHFTDRVPNAVRAVALGPWGHAETGPSAAGLFSESNSGSVSSSLPARDIEAAPMVTDGTLLAEFHGRPDLVVANSGSNDVSLDMAAAALASDVGGGLLGEFGTLLA
jgi:probable HAF family extracellular repeat protein